MFLTIFPTIYLGLINIIIAAKMRSVHALAINSNKNYRILLLHIIPVDMHKNLLLEVSFLLKMFAKYCNPTCSLFPLFLRTSVLLYQL